MDTGVFAFATQNLGDEMQSLAVAAHLARVDRFLDRDRLAELPGGEPVACVCNSWFLLGDDFRPPADCLTPIWFGFCAGRPELLERGWLEHLRDRTPIGCRDLFTTGLLQRHGIDAYWSGCLTLFLGRALPWLGPGERHGIVFVDVPPAAEAHLPRDITRRALRVSTFPAPGIVNDPLARWAALGRLVDLIARAELVVTRRLHVALPAASFGTPVVAVPDPEVSFARRRFSGFETVIPVVYLDEIESRRRDVDWHHVPPPQITPELLARYDALRAQLAFRGIGATPFTAPSPLDDVKRRSFRIRNVVGATRPGRLRLTMRERSFELGVQFWSNRFVDVGLSGFPGLSRFALRVEGQSSDGEPWLDWGALRELCASSTCAAHGAPLMEAV
jgi:hypothetical protein